MLVSKRRFLAAQEQVSRLQQELDEAHLSLTRYKEQERELVDALVAARVEARAVRNRAEDEAGSVLDGARDEALTIKAEARAQLAAAQAEITRLRDVQRELSTSLEQSLETLRSVLTHTALPQPSRADDNSGAVEQPARAPAVVPPDSARLAPIAAAREHWHAADQSDSPARDAARRDPGQVTAAVPRFESFSIISSKGTRALLALPLDRKSLLRAAGVAVVCVALVGGARWWRGSADRRSTATGQAAGPAIGLSTAPASAGDVPGSSQAAVRGSGARPVGTSRVRVALSALRPVWLRAEVDGKEAVARVVRAGEALEFKGANDVVLRAGDAGALLASVNGRAPAKLGRDGAVLTKRIAADHLLLSADARAARPPAPPPNTRSESVTSAAAKSTLQRPAPPAVSTQLPLRQVEASSPRSVDASRQTPAHPPSAPPLASAQAAPPAAPLGSTDEADVLRAHETYFEALRRGDSGQINRLVADGFTATGAPAADDSGLPYPLSLRNASVEIRGVGAVVSGTAAQRIRVSDGQSSRDQQLLFSEVWVKREGQWQLMNVRFVSPAGGR